MARSKAIAPTPDITNGTRSSPRGKRNTNVKKEADSDLVKQQKPEEAQEDSLVIAAVNTSQKGKSRAKVQREKAVAIKVETETERAIEVKPENETVAAEKKTTISPPKRGRKRKAAQDEEEPDEEQIPPQKKTLPSKFKSVKVEIAEEARAADVRVEEATATSKPSPKRRRKVKVEDVEAEPSSPKQEGGTQAGETKVKRKRKTKEEKEAEAMPLSARTIGHKLHIGAHVSSAGGVQNAVANAVHIGANAFALFLKSQRKWANPAMDDEVCTSFHSNIDKHTYDTTAHILPHGSYLVNLAHTDPARTTQAYDAFIDDLRRCERLKIGLYNFHPGNVAGASREKAIAHLASNLNRAHRETTGVVTLLENMAAGGNVIGSTFEDLRDTIALIDDKSRVGVCLDTCHAFAGGYDLRTAAALRDTLSQFDKLVGIKYLRAMHLNDSKAPFASHRDLHANIGTGFLGLRAFHAIVNEQRFQGLPLVLETPIEVRDETGELVKDEKGKDREDKGIWAREIKMLESMVGMDVESDEFVEMEKALRRKGEGERLRVQDQVDRRDEKARQKAVKGKGKKSKRADPDAKSETSSLSDLEGDL